MKTLEQGSNRFTTWLGNITAVDTDRITSQAAVKGYLIDGDWHNDWTHTGDVSLFYNGRFFWRKVYVDGHLRGVFWSYRWAGNDPLKKEYFQCGIGVKINGRLGVLFRLMDDQSAAIGVSGPNVNQAISWNFGTK